MNAKKLKFYKIKKNTSHTCFSSALVINDINRELCESRIHSRRKNVRNPENRALLINAFKTFLFIREMLFVSISGHIIE